MDNLTVNALITIALIGIDSVLAAARSAFVNARRPRLEQMAESGQGGAAFALRIARDSAPLIITIRFAQTICRFFAAGVITFVFAPPLALLFGRVKAHVIGRATLFAMVGLGLFVWSGLLFWALVVYFIAGTQGMPPMEDVTPLDSRRRVLAWSAFALLALILLPVPHALSPQIGLHCPYL